MQHGPKLGWLEGFSPCKGSVLSRRTLTVTTARCLNFVWAGSWLHGGALGISQGNSVWDELLKSFRYIVICIYTLSVLVAQVFVGARRRRSTTHWVPSKSDSSCYHPQHLYYSARSRSLSNAVSISFSPCSLSTARVLEAIARKVKVAHTPWQDVAMGMAATS